MKLVLLLAILVGCDAKCPKIERVNFCNERGWCEVLLDNGKTDQVKLPIEGMPRCEK